MIDTTDRPEDVPLDAKWDPCYIISLENNTYDVMLVQTGTSVFGIPARFIRQIPTSANASPVRSLTTPSRPASPPESSVVASPEVLSHSDTESKIDKLAEFLDCVICQKLLYKPVTLPCGHTFWSVNAWDEWYSALRCKQAIHVLT